MRILGFEITRKAAAPVSSGGGWYPIIREPYTGAWQANAEIRPDTVLQNPAVFRCVSLISTDVGKLHLCLVALDANGVWTETTSPAFSPVLRKPNRFQLIGQFLEAWMISKLVWGNAYILKGRDARGVVNALYVLDPQRMLPLVGPDGSVYYEIRRQELAGVLEDRRALEAMPASEIIHDRWNCLFHPLCGVSPLYACAGAAVQGLQIQQSSTAFFAGGSQPTGVVLVPGAINDEQLARLKTTWTGAKNGLTRFLTHGMTYQPVTQSAQDSQLTDQQKWCANTIAGVFGVPVSMVDSSQQPPYANSEASLLQYHSQCLQTHLTGIETCLDDGLELPAPYGVEFDLDDLIYMDTGTRTKAANESTGTLSPNEIRFKYFGVGPVAGGSSPMVQQQYYSLAELAKREAPAATPDPPVPEPPPAEDPPAPDETETDDETEDVQA